MYRLKILARTTLNLKLLGFIWRSTHSANTRTAVDYADLVCSAGCNTIPEGPAYVSGGSPESC